MGQPKVIATLVVALVLALVAFFVLDQPILAAVVVVVGLVGAFLLVRSAGGTLRRGATDDFFEVDEDVVDQAPRGSGGLAAWNPTPSSDAPPLATWSPGAGSAEPLSTWDPAAEPEAPAAETSPPVEPTSPFADPTSRFGEPTATPRPTEPDEVERLLRPTGNGFAEDTSTLSPFEAEPLAPWDEGGSAEPEVDEQAEIDRAARVLAGDDTRGSLFAESPINEEVSTADDIMAASEATELHIGGPAQGDDGELAKLLAKVQARLAAYE